MLNLIKLDIIYSEKLSKANKASIKSIKRLPDMSNGITMTHHAKFYLQMPVNMVPNTCYFRNIPMTF